MTDNGPLYDDLRNDPEKIIKTVAEHVGLTPKDIKGSSKMRSTTQARQVAAHLIRKYTRKSFHEIGEILNKDHTSIVYACKNVSRIKALNEMAFSVEVKLICLAARTN